MLRKFAGWEGGPQSFSIYHFSFFIHSESHLYVERFIDILHVKSSLKWKLKNAK
jgi:hypothetical protein